MANNGDPTYKTRDRVKCEPPAEVDVAIIGAGLGGLSAGAFLAQQGVKVAVFDQHYVAGGCCTQFSRGGPNARYNFDIGLHYIGDCADDGMIPRIMNAAGTNIEYLPMDQDGFDTLVFPDFNFRIPAGHDNYRNRLLEQFPQERKGIDRYVRFLKEIDALMRNMSKNQGAMTWGTAFQALTRGRLAAKYQNATLSDLLDTCTDNEQLRAVIAGQSGDYGIAPSKVSASLHAGLVNHYFTGAYYPKGGGQVVADELAERIENLGGTVHLRRGIEKILIDDGKITGIRTEKYKNAQFDVKTNKVISNADLQMTLNHLVGNDNLPEEWQQRSERFEMAASIFMTYLGIKGDMRERGMGNTNYWQFDSYDMETFYAATDMKPRGSYITCSSIKEQGAGHHAPEGVQALEAMTILPGNPEYWGTSQQGGAQWDYKKSDEYLALKEGIENDMIKRVDDLFPGSRENIVFTESSSPMTHIRFTRATNGTGYGIAATPEQFMANRPGYSGPVEGLYFAGASTRAGHGVLGSLMSGYRAARRVAREFDQQLPPY